MHFSAVKKYVVLQHNAAFNGSMVQHTVAKCKVHLHCTTKYRATLASSAHFNASTHSNSEQQNALFSSEKCNTVRCNGTLASSAHINGPTHSNSEQQHALLLVNSEKLHSTTKYSDDTLV